MKKYSRSYDEVQQVQHLAKTEKRKARHKHVRNALSWVCSLALLSTMMPVNALTAIADTSNSADTQAVEIQAEDATRDAAEATDQQNTSGQGIDAAQQDAEQTSNLQDNAKFATTPPLRE